jgi:hypothetical protein
MVIDEEGKEHGLITGDTLLSVTWVDPIWHSM